jgi:hypothetical protein
MMPGLPVLRVQVTADREVLPRERRTVENRIRFALERSSSGYDLQFSEVPDPTVVATAVVAPPAE